MNNMSVVDKLLVNFNDDNHLIDHLIDDFSMHHIEMIKQYEDFKYSHLTKKQQEADIKPIRNSKIDPKINRNDLCPCGSNKKYKNCCMK